MISEITLSIIVPMYNPDLTSLEKCLQSISKIKHKTEVLLIDDGSKNKEVEGFCNRFHQMDGRFRYFYQKNGGVSSARNLGLTIARGNFVSFVDADDSISAEAINELDLYTLKNAELIFFDLYEITSSGNKKRRELFSQETGLLDKEEIIKCFIMTSKLYECWGKLYRLDLIKQNLILFPYAITQGEDVIFNCMYFQYITGAYYYKEIFYLYNYIMSNTTQRFINNPLARLNDVFTNYKCLLALVEKTFDTGERRKYINVIINDYTCGFGSRLLLLAKYKLITGEIKKFIRFEVKPLLLQDRTSIFLKTPKACIYDLIIRKNLWFTFKILQHFKRVEI